MDRVDKVDEDGSRNDEMKKETELSHSEADLI